MAAAITTGHPTSDWRDETQGWARHPSTWGVTPSTELWTIYVVKWFISDILKWKWQCYRPFWTGKVTLFLCHIIFLSVHIVIHRYTDIIVLFDYIYVQHFTIVLIYKMWCILLFTKKEDKHPHGFLGNDKWYKYHEITDQIISWTQWWPVRTLHC
jgi:hypothetical protein